MGYKFYPDEVEQLKQAWIKMKDTKSDYSGSADGEHYKIKALLHKIGVREKFESSGHLENYVEYAITYGEAPDVF